MTPFDIKYHPGTPQAQLLQDKRFRQNKDVQKGLDNVESSICSTNRFSPYCFEPPQVTFQNPQLPAVRAVMRDRPVGNLVSVITLKPVLLLFGASSLERQRLSGAVCVGSSSQQHCVHDPARNDPSE
jgi:hypothetical protein